MRPSARRAWTAVVRQVARRRSVILGYHGVADTPHGEDQYRLQLPPAMFRAQLEILRDGGFRFVTVAEMVELGGSGPPPPGFAAISFDDGLRNNLSNALPILNQLGIRATIYVPTGWLGERHPDIGATADAAILTTEEVTELAAAGWEIGGHTVNHADLSLLDYAQCRGEIGHSCDHLAGSTGMEVRTFAYPYGRCGPAAIAAVRDCGLLAAVVTESKPWTVYELGRTMIGGADSLSVFILKITDHYQDYERLIATPPIRALRARIGRSRRDRAGTIA